MKVDCQFPVTQLRWEINPGQTIHYFQVIHYFIIFKLLSFKKILLFLTWSYVYKRSILATFLAGRTGVCIVHCLLLECSIDALYPTLNFSEMINNESLKIMNNEIGTYTVLKSYVTGQWQTDSQLSLAFIWDWEKWLSWDFHSKI